MENVHNIRPLFNFDPPAAEDEIRAAALQFVRKISGFTRPSDANRKAFDLAVEDITRTSSVLLDSLATSASPKNREIEAEKRRSRRNQRPESK